MIVVTDASPLHYLVLIGKEWLLEALHHHVVCPQTVLSECLHPHAPGKLQSWAANPPDWLHVITDSIHELPNLAHLAPGERAAILAAKTLGARLVLMDEKKGRQAAEAHGLIAVGVLGILVEGARRNLISFDETSGHLMRSTNFRVSESVMERARAILATPGIPPHP